MRERYCLRVRGAVLARQKITESVDLMRAGCERGSVPDSQIQAQILCRDDVMEFLSSVET